MEEGNKSELMNQDLEQESTCSLCINDLNTQSENTPWPNTEENGMLYSH